MPEEKAPPKTAKSDSRSESVGATPIPVIPALEDLLTERQRRDLANNLNYVLSVGYGELSIAVRGGKIRFMRVELSHEFSSKE